MNAFFLMIVICLLLTVLGVTLYSWHKNKLRSSTFSILSDSVAHSNNNFWVNEDESFLELLPKVIKLSNQEVFDFEKMYEIKDKRVLAKVNAMIPQIANSIYNNQNQKNIDNL